MAVRCVKTRWHHNAAPKPMQRSMKIMALFPYQFNCLCWKIALLDIALCLTLREWPPWCSKLCWLTFWHCAVKTMWPVWDFVLQSWAEIVYCRCDGNYGSLISDLNWIKNREAAAASRVTEPRLCWQMNQRMNEHRSLLFYSCHFVPSWFFLSKWSAFQKKSFSTTLHLVFPLHVRTLVLGWFLPMIPFFGNKQTSE